MSKYTEKEQLYLQAKEAYYLGDPLMEDAEFDELEEELRSENSSVIDIVGSNKSAGKLKHITPMGSLAKIQFKKDYHPIKEFDSFLKKVQKVAKDPELEFTLKYDGNAVNLIYELQAGSRTYLFIKAISRGDGLKGQDLTEKVRNLVPVSFEYSNDKGHSPLKIEIRGEVLMKNSVFNEYYSEFKNPRNLVAGILGKDDLIYENLNRLSIITFEMREHYKDGSFDYTPNSSDVMFDLGFNRGVKDGLDYRTISQVDILEEFELFTKMRAKSEFLTDGFVCKVEEEYRKEIGETSHHPKWAIAIKFPPKSVTSKIIDIEWNLGKTGYLTPVGILEPVNLDGSTVSRVTLHNYEWIRNKKVFPGAIVEIVKSGDIIPAIVNVIEESETGLELPEIYLNKQVYVTEDSKNLAVENYMELPEFGSNRLYRGANILGIQFIGPKMAERLFAAGIENLIDLFDTSLMSHEVLSENGDFDYGGREVQRVLDEIKGGVTIPLEKVIHALQFEKIGSSFSEKVAQYMAGLDVDWSGYEKAIVAKVTEKNSPIISTIKECIEVMERDERWVAFPEKKDESQISGTYELTGSPKEFGFKKKSEFIDMMKEKGFEHSKLNKDTTYLITDSMESTSSKMAKAEKLGVEIKLYSDFI